MGVPAIPAMKCGIFCSQLFRAKALNAGSKNRRQIAMLLVGLISLIHKGGTSKEMLPLRYTTLPAFFAPSFFELRLATLETKIVDKLLFSERD
jgi:hypothetical protein